MPYVSIHDYTNARVVIVPYSDDVENVEEEVVIPNSGGGDYEYMCMQELSLVINPDVL